MGNILRYVGLAIPVLLVGGWAALAVMNIFSLRKGPVWKFALSLVAGAIMVVGIAGFCGQGVLSAFGNWLPDSVEWPVGLGEGIAVATNGDYVVPLVAINRIQLYDAHWHFIRGWYADVGKGLKVYPLPGNRIGAVAQGYEIFTSHGYLLARGTFPSVAASVAVYNKIPNGMSHLVPTPLWLWPLTGPFASWVTAVAGLLLLIGTANGLGGRKQKPATGSPDRAIGANGLSSQQAGDATAVATHSFRTEDPRFIAWVHEQEKSVAGEQAPAVPQRKKDQTVRLIQDEQLMVQAREFLDQPRSRDYAWLTAAAIWTMQWVLVAGIAGSRALRFPDLASIVGACAAVSLVLWGSRATLRATRPRISFVRNRQSEAGSCAKLPGKWIVALIWCAVGLGWNVAVFSMLILAAWKGNGWLILFLLLWSFIGLFLLFIISSSIGIMTQAIGRASRQRN